MSHLVGNTEDRFSCALAPWPIYTVDKVFNDLSSENNKPSLSFLVCGISHGLSHPLPLNMVMLKDNRNNA